MIYNKKEVDFEYCKKCKHYEVVETEEPCCECLEHTYNFNTHKPVCYEEKKARIIEVDLKSVETTKNNKEELL